MKKYFYLVLMALIATAPLSFVSCGSDDDEKEKRNEQNGRFPYEKYLNGEITVYHAYSDREIVYTAGTGADWTYLYQYKDGSASNDGYTFYAPLSLNFKLEDVLNNITDEYVNAMNLGMFSEGEIWALACNDAGCTWRDWQFQTQGEIHEGDEIYLTAIFWDDHFINRDQESGKVYVKSIKDDKITLSFQDLKFQRCRVQKVGNSEFEELTVNGEITFTAQ